MKTLAQHTQERLAAYFLDEFDEKTLNGIECPYCARELFDSCPTTTLLSNPPKKYIHCEGCEYKGYRIA